MTTSKKKIFIRARGFIGDCLFAGSVAAHFPVEEYDLDFNIPVVQPRLLLENLPNVRNVYVGNNLPLIDDATIESYTSMFDLDYVDQSIPATIQFQQRCGIAEPTLGYSVIVPKEYIANQPLRPFSEKPTIGVMKNWIEKSFKFTREEYAIGNNIPDLGYGGRKHDVEYIKKQISQFANVVEYGLPAGTSQHSPQAADAESYTKMAADMYLNCDMFLGTEGGLTNLSAGLAIPTVITTDFIWQLYGPNGIFKKLEMPAMGPLTYFPAEPHLHIQPFADEDEIVQAVFIHMNMLQNAGII